MHGRARRQVKGGLAQSAGRQMQGGRLAPGEDRRKEGRREEAAQKNRQREDNISIVKRRKIIVENYWREFFFRESFFSQKYKDREEG